MHTVHVCCPCEFTKEDYSRTTRQSNTGAFDTGAFDTGAFGTLALKVEGNRRKFGFVGNASLAGTRTSGVVDNSL